MTPYRLLRATTWQAGIVMVLLATTQTAVFAQRGTGIVRDSSTSAPLSGAVISALDSLKHPLGRAIADATGRYFIELPDAAKQLRVQRIGFQPHVVTLPRRRDALVTLDLWMTRVPTLLSGVTVNDDRQCAPDKSRAGALSLWEQARAGLLTAVVARDALPAQATIMGYQREINTATGRVDRQTERIIVGSTSRPFLASDAPPVLAERGYMELTDVGEKFKGPDADVLLDDSFAQTHCFGVRPADTGHPDAIGLTFEPVAGRGGLVDVRGTLWVESAIPALRSLEFSYTDGQGMLDRIGAGGDLQFHTMPNGVAFIESWTLSLPVINRPQLHDGRIIFQGAPQIPQRNDTGGIVLSASWPDGSKWMTPIVPVTGIIVEPGSKIPLAGVLIGLEADGQSFHTDSTGHFEMFPVLPGRYMVQMVDTTLAKFMAPRSKSVEIELFPAESLDLHFDLQGRAQAIRSLCKNIEPTPTTSTILGRIVDSAGATKIPRDIRIVAEWTADGPTAARETRTANVDDAGRFSICGIPREHTVLLTATHSNVQFTDLPVIVGATTDVSTLEWTLDFPRLVTAVAPGMAAFRGHVTRIGDDGAIAGADVWFPTLDRHASTDSTGAFRIERLPAGLLLVQVCTAGYTLQRDTLTLAAGTELVRSYTLYPRATNAGLEGINDIPSPAKQCAGPDLSRTRER
jgi:hypothetical protein